jgi:hypothetical protein
MDAASNQLLLAAFAKRSERKPISGAQRRRLQAGTPSGAISSRLKPTPTTEEARSAGGCRPARRVARSGAG